MRVVVRPVRERRGRRRSRGHDWEPLDLGQGRRLVLGGEVTRIRSGGIVRCESLLRRRTAISKVQTRHSRRELVELDEAVAQIRLDRVRGVPRRDAILEDGNRAAEIGQALFRKVGAGLPDREEGYHRTGVERAERHCPPRPKDAGFDHCAHGVCGEERVCGFETNLGGFGVRIGVDAEVRPVQDEPADTSVQTARPRACRLSARLRSHYHKRLHAETQGLVDP